VNRIYFALLLALGGMPGVVMAGAGANVSACVNVTNAKQAMTVNIAVGGPGKHCMSQSGNNAAIPVPAGGNGLYCASVGYVEEKGTSSGGDFCATEKSKWPVSYSIGASPAQTSAVVSMEADSAFNKATIITFPQVGSAAICTFPAGGSPNLCFNTSTNWAKGTQGPLALIFTLPD
jgi:hypothetical protein